MTLKSVLHLPHPVLQQACQPVAQVGPAEQTLADELVATMRASPACVGLAANQIGVSLRAFCVDVTGHRRADTCHGLIVLFNPELLVARQLVSAREGCMSVPDLTGNVARASEVVIRGLDRSGREQVVTANAFEARALLHELDHLDGLLFLDRVDSFGADVFKRKRYR